MPSVRAMLSVSAYGGAYGLATNSLRDYDKPTPTQRPPCAATFGARLAFC